MWRIVLGLTALLTLALGGPAAACPSCGARTALESVRIDATDAGQSLVLGLRPLSPSFTMPDSGTAVVMFFNGNRSKCLNSPVRKASVDGNGLYTYRGQIPQYYGGDRGAIVTYTGRAEVAGDVYEFTAATDGTPGTARIVTDGTNVNAVATTAAPTAAVTAAPLPVTDTAIATAAAQVAPRAESDPWTPLRQPMPWLAAIVIVATIAGAYFDRRRASARTVA